MESEPFNAKKQKRTKEKKWDRERVFDKDEADFYIEQMKAGGQNAEDGENSSEENAENPEEEMIEENDQDLQKNKENKQGLKVQKKNLSEDAMDDKVDSNQMEEISEKKVPTNASDDDKSIGVKLQESYEGTDIYKVDNGIVIIERSDVDRLKEIREERARQAFERELENKKKEAEKEKGKAELEKLQEKLKKKQQMQNKKGKKKR